MGSLLGGYITYLGVFETIKYYKIENDKRSSTELELNRKKILPHLTASIESPIKNFEGLKISIHEEFETFVGVRLRNIGKDSCLNLKWSYKLISEKLQEENHKQVVMLEINSLVKNEFSSMDVFGFNLETCDLIAIEVDFCDLEYRRYYQKINIKILSSDNMGNGIRYTIESTEPMLTY